MQREKCHSATPDKHAGRVAGTQALSRLSEIYLPFIFFRIEFIYSADAISRRTMKRRPPDPHHEAENLGVGNARTSLFQRSC